MKEALKFEHNIGPYSGWLDRTPVGILEMMAARGQPDALEILRNIPHHAEKVGRSSEEELAINEQIKVVLARICTMVDLETRI